MHLGILWIRNGSVQEACVKYITFGELFWGISLGRAGIPYSKIPPPYHHTPYTTGIVYFAELTEIQRIRDS